MIGNESTNYTLTASGSSGPTGSELEYNNDRQFSTKDRVNTANGVNCGERLKGGWWFGNGFQDCRDSNLNGIYYTPDTLPQGPLPDGMYFDGIYWVYWKNLPTEDNRYSFKGTEMKIRKSQNN